MRGLLAFLAVTGLFVAINLVAAAIFWGGGRITLLVLPDADELWWAFLPAGLAGIAAAILSAKWGLAIIGRALAKARARARG